MPDILIKPFLVNLIGLCYQEVETWIIPDRPEPYPVADDYHGEFQKYHHITHAAIMPAIAMAAPTPPEIIVIVCAFFASAS